MLEVSIPSIPCTATLNWEEYLGDVRSGRSSSARRANRARFEIMVCEPLLDGFADEWLSARIIASEGTGRVCGNESFSEGGMVGPPRLRMSCSFNRGLIETRQRGLWPIVDMEEGGSTLRHARHLPAVRAAVVKERASGRAAGRAAAVRSSLWQPWHQKSFRDAFDYSGECTRAASSAVVDSHAYSHGGLSMGAPCMGLDEDAEGEEEGGYGAGGDGGATGEVKKPRPRLHGNPPSLRHSRSFDVAAPRADAFAGHQSLAGRSDDCALRRNAYGADGGRSALVDATHSSLGLRGEDDDDLGPLVPHLAGSGQDTRRAGAAAGGRGAFLTPAPLAAGETSAAARGR